MTNRKESVRVSIEQLSTIDTSLGPWNDHNMRRDRPYDGQAEYAQEHAAQRKLAEDFSRPQSGCFVRAVLLSGRRNDRRSKHAT